MLLLLFKIGDGRYALTSEQIVEVVPLVNAKTIPLAPEYIVGLMNCRGVPIPVVDLGILLTGTPCPARFSTRIVMVHYPVDENKSKPLGLIATDVTETIIVKQSKVPPSGVFMDDALYQSGTAADSEKMVQWFDLKNMLPAQEITRLFQD